MRFVEIYFHSLLSMNREINQLEYFEEKNKIWLDKYKLLEDKIEYCILDEYYPKKLALIHPDFLYNKFGDSIVSNLPKENKFSGDIQNHMACKIISLEGFECPFNSFSQIRGKCQADHIFPSSLGGPDVLENRILLCKYHNRAKSNAIPDMIWNNYLPWLNGYLEKIRNLKSC